MCVFCLGDFGGVVFLHFLYACMSVCELREYVGGAFVCECVCVSFLFEQLVPARPILLVWSASLVLLRFGYVDSQACQTVGPVCLKSKASDAVPVP